MSTLTFWKPGTAGPGSTLDRATEEEGNVVQSAPSHGSLSIQAQRERLPIWQHRMFTHCHCFLSTTQIYFTGQKLLHCIEKYGVTIVVGQTGSGKTTREQSSNLNNPSSISLQAENYPSIS
jgi:ATP-dependent RNA helicase DDX35